MFDRGMKYPVIVMRQSSKWNAVWKDRKLKDKEFFGNVGKRPFLRGNKSQRPELY